MGGIMEVAHADTVEREVYMTYINGRERMVKLMAKLPDGRFRVSQLIPDHHSTYVDKLFQILRATSVSSGIANAEDAICRAAR